MVALPSSWPFRSHLPAPPSLHARYGASQLLWGLCLPARTRPGRDLPASRLLPSHHSAATHPDAPAVAFARYPSARRASARGPGSSTLRLPARFWTSRSTRRLVSRQGRIAFDSCGLAVPFPLLSTSSYGDAVTVRYGPESVCPERTCTSLARDARRRTSAAPEVPLSRTAPLHCKAVLLAPHSESAARVGDGPRLALRRLPPRAVPA